MLTLRQAYNELENLLKHGGIDSYKSEARSIFYHCFEIDYEYIILNGDKIFSEDKFEKIVEIAEKRKSKIPLQYILGLCEFMGEVFFVGEGVLIPREDTSVLVEESYNILKKKDKLSVADLCSGSGCIAITLKKMLGDKADVYGIEISDKAYEYFSKNVSDKGENVKAIKADIFKIYEDFEDEFFDAVVSNPPYIEESDMNNLQEEVLFEPKIALNGGKDGLDYYRKICSHWTSKIKHGGIIAFEIGINQAEAVENILEKNGFRNIKIFNDINNIPRVVIGKRN